MMITCEEAERRLTAELPPGCVIDVNDDMEIDPDVFGRQVDVTLPDEPASPHEWSVIYQPTGENGQQWVPTLCVGSWQDDIDDFPAALDDDGCPDPSLVGRVVRQLIHDRKRELVGLGYLDD